MNTINEMCLAWFMWVNGNMDILIMTITLIVVTGLVLEVRRLNRVDYWLLDNISDLYRDTANLSRADEGQVNVNVHLAEDIEVLQKKVDLLGKIVGELKFKRKTIKK